MNRDEMRRGIDEAIAAGEADDELLERRAWLDEGTFGLPEDQLTHAIDVTSVLDRKRAALRAHASQISPDSFFLDRSDEEFARAFGTEWYRRHGAATRNRCLCDRPARLTLDLPIRGDPSPRLRSGPSDREAGAPLDIGGSTLTGWASAPAEPA